MYVCVYIYIKTHAPSSGALPEPQAHDDGAEAVHNGDAEGHASISLSMYIYIYIYVEREM